MDSKTQGMVICGIAASEAIDKVGERISVKGIDISSIENGEATLNIEHVNPGLNEGPDGKLYFSDGQETVGKILYAKKIFKRSDCDNKIQEKLWDDLELPYLFIIARLHDAAGHPGAMANAAQIRDYHANDEMVNCRLSIQGSTIKGKDGRLTETVARKVSLTLGPCNASCNVLLVSDPNAPEGFEKQPIPWSDLKGAEISKGFGRKQPIAEMYKSLSAGGYNAAPGSLTGGSALQKEYVSNKKRGKELLRSYEGPGDEKSVREYLKSELPELSESETEDLVNSIFETKRNLAKSYWTLQNIWVEINKAVPDRRIEFAGYMVDPGVLITAKGQFSILFMDKEYYYVVPAGMETNYGLGDLQKLPLEKEDTYFTVTSLPSIPLNGLT